MHGTPPTLKQLAGGSTRSPNPESRTPSPESRTPARGAFTLIELLVVIAIVAILLSVLVYAVRGALTTAKSAATVTLLQKVINDFKERSTALDNHVQSMGTQFDKYVESHQVFKDAGYDKDLARVLAKKDFYRQTFPQRFSEIPIDYDNDGDYDITDNGTAESAEVLYYAMTGEEIPHSGDPANGVDTPPLATIRIPGYMPSGRDSLTTSEYADTDNDGRQEVVDGWGRPLRFYRWPTRLVRPDGINVDTTNAAVINRALPPFDDLNRDPDDPLAYTAKPKWKYRDDGTFVANFHTLGTYHTLLVVSPGADGILGLYEPTDTANNGHLGAVADVEALNDDLSNLNARAGGK